MIVILGALLLIFLIVSVPLDKFLNWGFNQRVVKKPPFVHSPVSVFCFFMAKIGQFAIGYFSLVFLEQVFYYEDPSWINFGVLIMVVGFSWSVFQNFKYAGNQVFYILGILSFFNSHFFWLYLVLFLGFVLLINHMEMAFLIALCALYFFMPLFEMTELFLISNGILIIVLFIKEYKVLVNFFSHSPRTLIDRFYKR